MQSRTKIKNRIGEEKAVFQRMKNMQHIFLIEY